MRNTSGYANESESEGGAEKRSVTRNGGYTTGPQWPHASLENVSASASGIGTVIGTETETVLGRENEIGIGHLVVVVGTVARAVRAVVAVAVVAGMVEATATGHWLREWDSEILLSGNRPPTRSDGPT